MSQVETTSKVSLELTSRMILGGRGPRAKLSILDIVHKPLHSLERLKQMWNVSSLCGAASLIKLSVESQVKGSQNVRNNNLK